jgi:hypothetical protein
MKKKETKTAKKLSIEKFKIAELKNLKMIVGGDGGDGGGTAVGTKGGGGKGGKVDVIV